MEEETGSQYRAKVPLPQGPKKSLIPTSYRPKVQFAWLKSFRMIFFAASQVSLLESYFFKKQGVVPLCFCPRARVR